MIFDRSTVLNHFIIVNSVKNQNQKEKYKTIIINISLLTKNCCNLHVNVSVFKNPSPSTKTSLQLLLSQISPDPISILKTSGGTDKSYEQSLAPYPSLQMHTPKTISSLQIYRSN